MAAVGLVQSVTAANGPPSSFVPITPCRLVDTRPGDDHVGARPTAIGANEVVTLAVWGTNGDCTIPTTATGIATNTTAVNPTAGSFLTVYPADASPRPKASNLDYVAGSPPTPNQVTVGLSAAGAIDVYNLAGTVDVIVDIVGYYKPASGAGASGNQSMFIDGAGFAPVLNGYVYNAQAGGISSSGHACFTKSLNIPNGATITLLSAVVSDFSTTQGADLELHGTDISGLSEVMTQLGTGQAETPGKVSGGNNSITNPVVNNAAKAYSLIFCGDTSVNFLSAAIDYTLP
ncbi:MAG: hypothetical protein ACXV8L_15280 [Ilumatobacteraceae bacterium]